MFPASQGSLYGRSPHGMMAAFKRPTARTRCRGLYLTGGGAHPGAGVPMAVFSAHARGRGDLERPAFNIDVPPGGYAWWYIDGVSDDGTRAVSIIGFIGSVFSPWYAWSGRGDPTTTAASTWRPTAKVGVSR